MTVETEKVAPPKPTTKRYVKPQITAWLVLISSFVVFCWLVLTAATALVDYFSRSVQILPAQLSISDGATVYIQRVGQTSETLAKQAETVNEGDTIRTVGQGGTASLTFFDRTSLKLSDGGQVAIRTSRTNTTQFVSKQRQLSFDVKATSEPGKAIAGQVVITVRPAAKDTTTAKPILVNTDDGASISLDPEREGTYQFELKRGTDINRTTIAATPTNNANANVTAAGKSTALQPGRRLVVDPGLPPTDITGQEKELLENGAFLNGLDYWSVQRDTSKVDCAVFNDSEKIDDATNARAHTQRYQNATDGYNCSLNQKLNNVNVKDYTSLKLSVKVKIKYQDLSGGGQYGSEYPAYIRLDYVDQQGNEQFYFMGFYKEPENPQDGTKVYRSSGLLNSLQILPGEWYNFEVDLSRLRQRPITLKSITVGSQGHQYEAYFTEVSLVGKS